MPQRAAPARIVLRFALLLAPLVAVPLEASWADDRQEACKKAMNDRIQVCADDCTKTALAAASHYVDTNNNVKFGCIKGCAIRQMWQMQACRNGTEAKGGDPTETNH